MNPTERTLREYPFQWLCGEPDCIKGEGVDLSRVGAREQAKVHAQKTGHKFIVIGPGEEPNWEELRK